MSRFFRIPFLLTFILISVSLLSAEISYIEYESQTGDTLFSVAENIYSKLDFSENDKNLNRYRSALILRANRALFSPVIIYTSMKTFGDIIIPENSVIRVPVYDYAYPEILVLEQLMEYEIDLAAGKIKDTNEYYPLKKLSDRVSYSIYSALFSVNDDNHENIEFINAQFYNPDYSLSDGSFIPGNPRNGNNRFVWQIKENSGSSKTVYLFPDDLFLDNDPFLRFSFYNRIIQSNPDKNPFFIFAGNRIQSFFPDASKITVPQKNKYIDYKALLQNSFLVLQDSPVQYIDTSPLVLNSFYNKDAARIFLEDDSSYSEEQNKLVTRNGEKYFLMKDEFSIAGIRFLSESNAYINDMIKLFAAEIEKEIITSVKSNGITSSTLIDKINILQIEFAELFHNTRELVFDSSNFEKAIDIFIKIDVLCSSDTNDIYLKFYNKIGLKKNEQIGKFTSLEKQFNSDFVELQKDLIQDMEILHHKSLRNIFNDLPDNSIAFCEIDSESIKKQLEYSDSNQKYNVVVYYSPSFDPEIKENISQYTKQNITYIESLESYLFETDIEKEIIFPVDALEEINANNGSLDKIVYGLYFLKNMNDYGLSFPVTKDNIRVIENKIPDIGSIYRICIGKGNNIQNIFHIFLPAVGYEEKKNIIREQFSENKNEIALLVLLKYINISQAIVDL